MTHILPLEKMSLKEKLLALEELWDDLSHNPEAVAVPEWHKSELDARMQKVAEGQAEFEDWATIKQRLRNKTQ